MPNLLDAHSKMAQTWIVDATRNLAAYPSGATYEADPADRLRYQLLIMPEAPIQVGPDGVLRVTIVHNSEVDGVNLGNFRISATASDHAQTVLDVRASLRPILSIPVQARTPQQAEMLTAHYRSVAPDLAPARQKIAELKS